MTTDTTATATGGTTAPTTSGSPTTVNTSVSTTDINPTSASVAVDNKPPAPAVDTKWKDSLGELSKNPTIANVKSLEDLAKMVVSGEAELGRLRGQVGAKLPPADAKPEEFEKFFQQYAPAKPEDYKLDARPEGLPEGVEFKPELAAEFAKVAQKAGLHPHQAKAMQAYAAQMATAEAAARQAEATALTDTYKKQWGEQYEAKVNRAGDFMSKMLPPEQVTQLQGLDGKSRALLAVVLDKVIDTYVQDDSITTPTSRTGTGPQSEAELKQELTRIQSDPAYFNEHVDKVKHAQLKQQSMDIAKKIANQSGRK